MPLFEYECEVCGRKKEIILPLSEYQKEIICDYCLRGVKMRKLFHPTLFVPKASERRWGRWKESHFEKGEVKKSKMPFNSPLPSKLRGGKKGDE